MTKPRTTVLAAAAVIGGFVALLWGVEVVDVILEHRLDDDGVRPRTAEGLWGILFAPLLHGGWGHLAANSTLLLLLGFLILLSGIGRWLLVTAIVWVVGGLGTWVIGQDHSVHIGASGLVFGWLTYLILRGIFAMRLGQIALGAVLLFAYGGVLWGVLPGQPGISWQGHLFGALGGGLAAWLLARRPEDELSSR